MAINKSIVRLVVVYAIAVVLVCVVPGQLHRRAFDRAFMTWLHDPTSENQKALRVEERKNDATKVAGSAAIALVLVAAGAGVYFVIRSAGRKFDLRRASKSRIPLVR
jgi:hypothetical protein